MYMSHDLLIAFSIFAFVGSITPGPNNVMLLSSGANFGFRRTIPHMLGITIGFSIMVLLVGLGLGSIFEKYPIIYTVLRYFSAAYLVYLAWKIAHAEPVEAAITTQRPLTFFHASMFQWINPKAWVMVAVAVTTYASEQHYFANVLMISVLYILFVLPSGVIWSVGGIWLRRYLSKPLHLRIFNISMAILLILSLYPLFTD